MNACLILGGDPTYGHSIGVHNFQVPLNIIGELAEFSDNFLPFENFNHCQLLPNVKCAICAEELPLSPFLDRRLTSTHINSSLSLASGEIFLFCRGCADKLKDYFIERGYFDTLLAAKL